MKCGSPQGFREINSIIQDNTQDGLNVSSASSAQIRGGNVIQGNNLSETFGEGESESGRVQRFQSPPT